MFPLEVKRGGTRGTALSGHRKPIETGKKKRISAPTKDVFSIPYTRYVYQCGEYENASTPKIFPLLMDPKSDTGLYTFGKDRLGGLGHGPDVKQQDQPKVVEALENIPVSKIFSGFGQAAAVTDSGKLYTWGNGKFTPQMVDLPNAFLRVVQVALGSCHVAVRVQSGDIFTWGGNLAGQLGLGITAENVVQPTKVPNLPPVADIKASYVHLLALTTTKELYVWGRNTLALPGETITILYAGQPDIVRAPYKVAFEGSGKISQIACGHEFNVVLTDDGKVWTWGRAKCGCLGNGSEDDHRSVPMQVKALEHVKIDHISCGIRHTAAWNASGAIYTWGYGDKGNLGHGETENQFTPKLIQTLPFTPGNTPFDGVKNVVCSLSQTFILWERYSLVEQALKYLEAYGLEQEGLFRINPSLTELANIQTQIETGDFIDFPPNNPHLVAAFLLRLLKSGSSLLPHSIVQYTLTLEGVVDKPLRDLRVLASIGQAIDDMQDENRAILARFVHFLLELSLHPVTKMTLRNLVICVGTGIFGTGVDSLSNDMTAIALATKETAMIQECGFLLLQNAPVFFDTLLSGMLQLCNFVDHFEAPSTLENLSFHEYTPKTRQTVASLLDQPWASFDVSSIFAAIEKSEDSTYVVPFVEEIPVANRRSMAITIQSKLDLVGADLRAALSHVTRAKSVVTALQLAVTGVDLLIGGIFGPATPAALKGNMTVLANESTLVGLLENSIKASEAYAATRRGVELVYLGTGGLEEILQRRRGEELALMKERLERELQQVLRELQLSSTQITLQQKKRDEEAAAHLRDLRQHITDAMAVYNLKSSELVVDVLRQLTLPKYYHTGEPPTVRTKSVLMEILVCFLELIQNEWESTVTSLHTTKNSEESWSNVLEVYTWFKGIGNLYLFVDSIGDQLKPIIDSCKEYIPNNTLENEAAGMRHLKHVFEETSRYIKRTQYSTKSGDYLYEVLEAKLSKT